MERKWITNNLFPVESWSSFKFPIRTNNDTEGWHHRLNSKGRANLNLYLMVGLLHHEALEIPHQIQSLSRGAILRYQRTSQRRWEAKLAAAWDSLTDGDMSAKQFLQLCSKVSAGPIADEE